MAKQRRLHRDLCGADAATKPLTTCASADFVLSAKAMNTLGE